MPIPQIDILLIRPNSNIPFQMPPLGLGYLASSLIKNGISVDIKDCLVENMPIEKIIDFISKRNIKIVGISCCTDEVNWVRELVKKLKSALGTKIILGGPHSSGVLEKIYSDINDIDFSIYSEGEISLPLLVKAILQNDFEPMRLEKIPNLIWKNKTKIIRNFLELQENLDDIDFPAWDLINPKKYLDKTPHGFIYNAKPSATMTATRGCPCNCAFCSTNKIHGDKIRKRSPDNIIAEIEYLSGRHGVKEIFFEDDNFVFNSEFVKDVCNKISELKSGMFFSLPNGIRIEKLNEETLSLMRKANFRSFSVGIESGSHRILHKMRKGTDLDMIKNKVSLAKKYGFYITGFFIMGYPDETKEDINLTIKYAKELKIDKAVFATYIPLPGTDSYKDLINNGEIEHWQCSEAISIRDIPYSPKGISKDELRKYCRKAVKSFYFRPSIILRNIFRVKLFSQHAELTNIIKRYFSI